MSAAALERAAQLTPNSQRRGRLLMRAAEMEFELGRPDRSLRLLREAEPLELGWQERTRMSFVLEMLDQGSWSGATRVASFVEIAEQLRLVGETERAVDALLAVALRCWWGNPGQETRDLVVAAVERIPVAPDNPAQIAILALADPVNRGALVIDRISRLTPGSGFDPAAMFLIGSAATAVWAHDLAAGFLADAVDGFRAQGRVGLLAQALATQAWAAVHLANSTIAMPAAEEADRLAGDTGQPRWAAAAQLAQATMVAERGDSALAESLAADAERVLLPMGANPMLALVQLVRGRAALADERHDDAFEQLRRIFDPTDVAYHPFVRGWAGADLAEAAAHSGNRAEARAHVEELESVAAATGGPLLTAVLSYTRPALAENGAAGALYDTALATDLSKWPSARARVLLGYGTWLRRERSVAEARAPLRAARETFDALGLTPWAERARRELRASGETSRRRIPEARDQLTPQELQIAQMAAGGLSNWEIGQRLYLSHRTVGSHLYRMFPKLGITSRSQLGAVLSSDTAAAT